MTKRTSNIPKPKAHLRQWALLLLSLCALPALGQTLNAHLDSTTIRIGSQAHLTLTVTAPEHTTIAFPDFQPQKEITPGLEVVETRTDTIDATHIRHTITLTAWQQNHYNVPALTIRAGHKTLQSRAIPLDVTTIAVDTTATAQPRPPHTVAPNPFAWSDWASPFWFTLTAALLLALVYYFSLRLKQNKPIAPRIRFIRRLLPHQRALQQIERLKSQPHDTEDLQRQYYTELTDTLRQYLEERFAINAREMTTPQIISRLQEQDPERTAELREVFETADLVKFARYAAQQGADDLYLQRVATFIDDTKQENQPTVERAAATTLRDRLKTKERLGAILLTAALALTALALIIAALIKAAEVLGL